MPRERVAIVRVNEQRLDEAAHTLLDLLGGVRAIVPAGSRVLIKPNFTIAPTDQGITHPELIESVLRLVADAAPGEVVIAESSGDCYTSYCYRVQGMYRIAARYGARLVDLNVEEGVKTPVPEGLGRTHVMVPRVVAESDVLISIPVFKLWGNSPLSLSLKNLFGLYGARYYGHNKDSQVLAAHHPFFARPGEVGTEMGIHQPSLAQSVCAVNCAARTHLAIIDGLEGGDGAGNWIRLDTLVAGRNPVATDTVGLAMAGLTASEHPVFTLCHRYGLGPMSLDEIDVVGQSIEDVAFRLERLRQNVLEMPVSFCLNLLSTGELAQMHRGMALYGLAENGAEAPADRATLLRTLQGALTADDYYARAVDALDEHSERLLQMIIAQGGTSGDLIAIRAALSEQYGGGASLHYAPAARTLARLGLAYAVEGANRHYYLLAEGVSEAHARRNRGRRNRAQP